VTLDQALDMPAPYPLDVVGVTADTGNTWWDPCVLSALEWACAHIHSFQVCDWLVPVPDTSLGRGLSGGGPIGLPRRDVTVDVAGYHGPIEVENLNSDVGTSDRELGLEQFLQRCAKIVPPVASKEPTA
jgi:sugar phosphate isomerase/epimerase